MLLVNSSSSLGLPEAELRVLCLLYVRNPLIQGRVVLLLSNIFGVSPVRNVACCPGRCRTRYIGLIFKLLVEIKDVRLGRLLSILLLLSWLRLLERLLIQLRWLHLRWLHLLRGLLLLGLGARRRPLFLLLVLMVLAKLRLPMLLILHYLGLGLGLGLLRLLFLVGGLGLLVLHRLAELGRRLLLQSCCRCHHLHLIVDHLGCWLLLWRRLLGHKLLLQLLRRWCCLLMVLGVG